MRAIAATTMLTEEATKPTLGQNLEVLTPHRVRVIPGTKGYLWLTREYLTKNQAMLLDITEVLRKICATLHPAWLIPTDSGLPLFVNRWPLSSMQKGRIMRRYGSMMDVCLSLRKNPFAGYLWWKSRAHGPYFGIGVRKSEYLHKVNIYTDFNAHLWCYYFSIYLEIKGLSNQ